MATEAPAGALSPETVASVMTVHHHHHRTSQSHHQVAALSGIALANSGINLTRMSGLDHHAHSHRLDAHNMVIGNGSASGLERLANGLISESRSSNINNNNNNNNNNSSSNNNNNNNRHERGDSSMTMPPRSRFMITDILAGAASPSSLQNQEHPGSPPSTPRDLSVRHQSRSSLNNSTVDEDSDTSHHDTVSVSSNGEYYVLICTIFYFCIPSNFFCYVLN